MISWISKKQKSMELNTAEAEYIVACDACTEAVWLCKLISGIFDQVSNSTMILCDNQSCVNISENMVFDGYIKYIDIDIKYYYIRDRV
jgi:hypothetical protein